MKKKNKPDFKHRVISSSFTKKVVFFTCVFFTLLLFLTFAFLWTVFLYQSNYKQNIFPQTYAQEIELSGMTKEQAYKVLDRKIEQIYQDGITVIYDDKTFVIASISLDAVNPELATTLYDYDIDRMIDHAYGIGRAHNHTLQGKLYNTIDQIKAFVSPSHIPVSLKMNEEALISSLKEKLSAFEDPMIQANLDIQKTPGGFDVKASTEQKGKTFNYAKLRYDISQQLKNLESPIVHASLSVHNPTITKSDIQPYITPLKTLLNDSSNISFTYEDKKWEISKEEFALWLTIDSQQNKTQLSIKEPELKTFLDTHIAGQIEKKPINAKFVIQDNKVSEFQPGIDGKHIHIGQTIQEILAFIANYQSVSPEIPLHVVATPVDIKTQDTNVLGIKELIGTGVSYYDGSPANRRHNIKTGADTLHGILIKPGEEFSLVKALGKIDASTGYKTELVIKGDRTVPEYGGGLCQIGTTVFRAALNTGLPITERRNHSFRVRYYEPAGTDATIYDPSPDFKFLNDTPHHILIQSRIEGSTLYFDFWGTKDARIAHITDPVIYNIVPAGPTKYIETDELQPGQTKCVESPHDGATAKFDYTVTYSDGEEKKVTFTSYYRPWPQVCLVGKNVVATQHSEQSVEINLENIPQG